MPHFVFPRDYFSKAIFNNTLKNSPHNFPATKTIISIVLILDIRPQTSSDRLFSVRLDKATIFVLFNGESTNSSLSSQITERLNIRFQIPLHNSVIHSVSADKQTKRVQVVEQRRFESSAQFEFRN